MNAVFVELEPRSPLLNVPLWMPAYLPSLAAVWRAGGHPASFVEAISTKAPPEDRTRLMAEAVIGRDPDLVVFDVRMENWRAFRVCAAAVRTAHPGVKILAGGRHATLCPDDTLQFCDALDGVLVGEGERVMDSLARGAPLAETPGLAIRQDGTVRRTPGLAYVDDLDRLPFPAWDLLDTAYHARRTPRVIPCIPLRTATLESSRGCTARCTFCSEGLVNAKIHRHHSPAYVIDAIRHLIRTCAIDGLYFVDENFLADGRRVTELCEAMLSAGIPRQVRWCAQVRADTVDPEVLSIMRRAGCVQLEFGIESGSQRMLNALAKGTRVEQNAAALRMARDAGIRTHANIVIGLPGETRDDLLATVRFLEETDPDIVRFNPLLLLPGTPAVARLVKEGRLRPDFWRDAVSLASSMDSDACNVSAMPLHELRRLHRHMDRRISLPRFLRDYLGHNRVWDVPSHFNAAGLLRFWARRMAVWKH